MAVEQVAYRPEYALEIVKMWRLSFQRAMGLPEQNEFADLSGHLDAFTRIDSNAIHLLLDTDTSTIVAFMALQPGWVNQLYVHVDWQGQGLGSQLLNQAKAHSPEGLHLHTFQRNENAQAFYLAHGFREVQRGFARADENPWATSQQALADILYAWQPG
jgi:ribosomal protein S18 acetylase RimI-like enzyme